MSNPPVKVKDAPGLVWRKRANGYEARWQARGDLIERGWMPKSERLWCGEGDPSETDWNWISDRCRTLQTEMLIFSRGGVPEVGGYRGTLASLIHCYKTDVDSPYRKLRYTSRVGIDFLTKRLERDHGHEQLEDLKGRIFLRWYAEYSDGGKKPTVARHLIKCVRTMASFGATILEDPECERMCSVLSKMRFSMGKQRAEHLSATQAIAIRAKAHELGRPSIALAQAIQFEVMLRQKDVIGEWVPMTEPGSSDVTHGNNKWLRGVRWTEIDKNLILRHVTSKRQKEIVVNLRNAPMVMEEFAKLGEFPKSGPLIICERTKRPWLPFEFRRWWRIVADAAGIPKTVKNMDSRAGGITEATEAGADLEHVRHAATHENISMTQRYSRGAAEKIESVMRQRVAHRNKPRTKTAENE